MKKLVPILVAAVVLLTGCTGTEVAAPEVTHSASASPSPRSTPVPKPSPVVTEAEHVISPEARAVLDANLGAGFEASPAIKEQYCTMSDAMLASAAEIAVDTWRGITEADVISYVEEVCLR